MDGKNLIFKALIAELLKEQRIRIRYNAEYLEPSGRCPKNYDVFTKPAEAAKTIIFKRIMIDPKLLTNCERYMQRRFQ